MKQQLAQAVAVFTDALCKVPGTQLQHIEKTLRQLREDLTKSGIGVLAEIDSLIEDAAIAHAEEMAYYNGMLTPEQEELYYEMEEEYYHTMCAEAYSLGMTPAPVAPKEYNDLPF